MCFNFNKKMKNIYLNVLYYKKDYTLKCHKIIDEYWHYLICYKLSFNLLRNDIQFTCINKCAMWITFFWKFGNFFKNKKTSYTNCIIHNNAWLKNNNGAQTINFNFKDIFIWSLKYKLLILCEFSPCKLILCKFLFTMY
jgi:hypothetical protein